MNNTIIFLSLLVLFLSAMLIIKISLVLDINKNLILIIFKVYGIKFLTINISLIGLHYKINNSKKYKKLKIIDKKDAYLFMQIKKSIFNKLYYEDISLISEIGVFSAKDTAIVVSIENIFCMFLKNKLALKNKDTNFTYSNMPVFEENKILIKLDIKVFFTIFDLVFALIMSFYKRGKYVKQKAKQKRHIG